MAIIEDFYNGDTVKWNLEFTDDNDDPIDISGWEFITTFKSDITQSDSEADLQVTVAAPANAMSQAGSIDIILPSDKTINLLPKTKYDMDIQRKINGTPPDILTIHAQSIKILYGVTQSV